MTEQGEINNFHMVQVWLGTRRLAELGRMLHLPLAQTSANYLTHCALGELFQDQAPGPFCVEDAHRQIEDYDDRGGRFIRVLGYADVDRKTLQSVGQGFASPAVYETCDWERCASKPMPRTFSEGLHLRFDLRACPIVRKASGGPRWSKGQELDAFLSRVWEMDDPSVEVDREDVYRDWLSRQLDLRGGAEAVSIGMERFSIERMTRRTHNKKRKVRTIQRPDVTLTGELKVTDGATFAELLKRGVGRHRSFGFGMLKIRRV